MDTRWLSMNSPRSVSDGFHGGKIDSPVAFVVGFGGGLLVADLNGDGIAGIGCAPDRQGLSPLEDHVILKKSGGF